MTTITALFAALPFWVGTAVMFVLFALLWIARLVLDVVAKDVIKAQGGDALAQRINRALTLFRTGVTGEESPRRPYAVYFGNALRFLFPCALAFTKVVFFSVGDPYTAILHVFGLVLWPFLYPISHCVAALAGVPGGLVLFRGHDEPVCQFGWRTFHPHSSISGRAHCSMAL
jgi:hypothetical protein